MEASIKLIDTLWNYIMRKKSYGINITFLLSMPIFILQLFLFGLNYYNVDMPHYINRFDVIQYKGMEAFNTEIVDIGFNYINYIFSFFSGNYQFFLFFLSVICLCLCLKLCNYYKANYLFFFFLFLFSVFFLEVVIVRQYLASLIFAYATQYLFPVSGREKRILFLLFLLISISIHITFILTMGYYILSKFRVRNIIIISLAGLLMVFFSMKILFPIAINVLGDKYSVYNEAINAGIIPVLAKTIHSVLSVIMIYYGHRFIVRFRNNFKLYQLEFSEFVLKVAILNIAFLPLMNIGMSFERLLLIPVFLYLIQASMVLSSLTDFNVNKFIITLGWFIWALFSYRIFIYSDSEGTIYSVLQYNLLMDLLW